jgi:AraC-like DNA-binding protein
MRRKSIVGTDVEPKDHGFLDERHVIFSEGIVEKAAKLPVVRDLLPSKIGHFPSAASHFVRRFEPLDEHILMYCIEGRGWCSFGNKRWRLGPDMAIVLPAGMAHSYGTTKRSPWTMYWMHMIGKRVGDYLEALEITDEKPLLHLKRGGKLIHHLEELYDLLHHGHSASVLLALSTSLAHFLGELNLQRRSPGRQTSTTEDNVRETIAFMRQNLSQILTLEQLAEYARLSVPHYTFVFRKLTGKPPVKFFLQLKMWKAAELLSDPGRKVKDVADQVGISDPYYFSRLFKKMMGASPTKYRERKC